MSEKEFAQNTNKTKTQGRTKQLVMCAVLAACALILSYVEVLIPFSGAMAGFKIGLANTAVLLAMYLLGVKAAFAVNVTRILLAALLFGTPVSMLYAFCGGMLSLLLMCLLKKMNKFSVIAVSAAGGVFHNFGQIAAAAFLMKSGSILRLLPAFGLAGMLCGLITGVISAFLVLRLPSVLGKANI